MRRKLTFLILVAAPLLPLMAQQQGVAEWMNISKFEGMNMKLAEPTPGENRVVFMGNSITEGWPGFMPEMWDNPAFINRGISGQTTGQMLLRFRRDVVDLKPAVVVILAGTNDIAQNAGPVPLELIRDNIFSMCEVAAANKITVVICSVLPVLDYPWRPGLEPAQKIVTLNSWLEEYATAHGHTYIDMHAEMATPEDGMIESYAYDGVHPSKEGYQVMYDMLMEYLGKL